MTRRREPSAPPREPSALVAPEPAPAHPAPPPPPEPAPIKPATAASHDQSAGNRHGYFYAPRPTQLVASHGSTSTCSRCGTSCIGGPRACRTCYPRGVHDAPMVTYSREPTNAAHSAAYLAPLRAPRVAHAPPRVAEPRVAPGLKTR